MQQRFDYTPFLPQRRPRAPFEWASFREFWRYRWRQFSCFCVFSFIIVIVVATAKVYSTSPSIPIPIGPNTLRCPRSFVYQPTDGCCFNMSGIGPLPWIAESGLVKLATGLFSYGSGFRVWSPYSSQLYLNATCAGKFPVEMVGEAGGWWFVNVGNCTANDSFHYISTFRNASNTVHVRLLDPRARRLLQTDDVFTDAVLHQPNNPASTNRQFVAPSLRDLIMYELHVPTYSVPGNQSNIFVSIESRLDYLVDLGVNALKLMPVFEDGLGLSSGYDIFSPFAIKSLLGDPSQLRSFISTCHQRGLAVILDLQLSGFKSPNIFQPYAPLSSPSSSSTSSLASLSSFARVFSSSFARASTSPSSLAFSPSASRASSSPSSLASSPSASLASSSSGTLGSSSPSSLASSSPSSLASSSAASLASSSSSTSISPYLSDLSTVMGSHLDLGRPEVVAYVSDLLSYLVEEFQIDGVHWSAIHCLRRQADCSSNTPVLNTAEAALSTWNYQLQQHSVWSFAEDLMQPPDPSLTLSQPHQYGFDSQWDEEAYWKWRKALLAVDDNRRSMTDVMAAIRGSTVSNISRILYLENHSKSNPRLPVLIDAQQPVGRYATKRAALALALILTSQGIPLIFSGQEFLSTQPFSLSSPSFLDWSPLSHYPGFFNLTRELIHTRRHTPSLAADSSLELLVLDDSSKAIAFLRGDLVLVLVNGRDGTHQFKVGVPTAKAWRVVFNGDRRVYSSWFGGVSENVEVVHPDPQPVGKWTSSIVCDVGAYAVIILIAEF
eukprot:TRINITY_DN6195_c0_g2_i1.p1 TRINITY_DN6195_c0_g2~~TRINITY_DN6195_c0_g2_i1.p1  ORF type:complete len:778 (-),score=92.39 TRINITY_DN6195_c0_g2_i1:44-2377(-)